MAMGKIYEKIAKILTDWGKSNIIHYEFSKILF